MLCTLGYTHISFSKPSEISKPSTDIQTEVRLMNSTQFCTSRTVYQSCFKIQRVSVFTKAQQNEWYFIYSQGEHSAWFRRMWKWRQRKPYGQRLTMTGFLTWFNAIGRNYRRYGSLLRSTRMRSTMCSNKYFMGMFQAFEILSSTVAEGLHFLPRLKS